MVRRMRLMNRPSTLRREPTMMIQATPASERRPSNKESKSISRSKRTPYVFDDRRDFVSGAYLAHAWASLEPLKRRQDRRTPHYVPGLKLTSTVLASFAARVTF